MRGKEKQKVAQRGQAENDQTERKRERLDAY